MSDSKTNELAFMYEYNVVRTFGNTKSRKHIFEGKGKITPVTGPTQQTQQMFMTAERRERRLPEK